jgi:MFS family permease
VDFLASPPRRKFLFAMLYLSEGAPIGFLWLALPTRLRASQVPLEEITWLMAVLVIPWTFKFAWAPLIDLLRSPGWTYRHWILVAQSCMALTLLPLFWLDPVDDFRWLAVCLVVHAFTAATQDVAIDGLCISVTEPAQRGQYNGYMQAGMLVGRSAMGGGALVLAQYVAPELVVRQLICIILLPALLVLVSTIPAEVAARTHANWRSVVRMTGQALAQRNTWFGLAFGLFGGAAFKSLEVIYGPFLIERGYPQVEIGWFSAGPMIMAMIAGSVVGGALADRCGRRRFVAGSLVYVSGCIAALAVSDALYDHSAGLHLFAWLAAAAFGIGLFTAASYTLFMDLTQPTIAATQFSAFMGSTNGCESWSSFAIGKIIVAAGYPAGMLAMCAVSLLALPLLLAMTPLHAPSPDETL